VEPVGAGSGTTTVTAANHQPQLVPSLAGTLSLWRHTSIKLLYFII